MKLITNSQFTKRDFKKIESMILRDVKREITRQMDEWILDRAFAQMNQE